MSVFLPQSLDGDVAIVTGGGSGIGLEIAKQLADHGCRHIMILGRRENILKEACRTIPNSSYHFCDVRSYENCEKVVKSLASQHGFVSILINSAAGNFLAAANQISSNAFKTVIDIDLVGSFNMARACFQYLKLSPNGGKIVNISATLHLPATWWQVHASAAKSGIDSMTRSLALEWGKYAIRVNSLAPGPIADTPGMTKLAPAGSMKAAQIEKMVKEQIPVGRQGTKHDIAQFVVFLCSKSAEFVSGSNLICDGANQLYKRPFLPEKMVTAISKQLETKSRL